MNRVFTRLFFACLAFAALAKEPGRFYGIWAAGGVEKGGPALFLFPNGKAYFNAMCGKAAGTWKILDSDGQIGVSLREESTGPFDDLTFQIDSRGWLIRIAPSTATRNSPASVASESLQELEKSKHALPRIE